MFPRDVGGLDRASVAFEVVVERNRAGDRGCERTYERPRCTMCAAVVPPIGVAMRFSGGRECHLRWSVQVALPVSCKEKFGRIRVERLRLYWDGGRCGTHANVYNKPNPPTKYAPKASGVDLRVESLDDLDGLLKEWVSCANRQRQHVRRSQQQHRFARSAAAQRAGLWGRLGIERV